VAPSLRGDWLYAVTGDPVPDFDGALWPGDDPHADRFRVMLDQITGELAWYIHGRRPRLEGIITYCLHSKNKRRCP
jgi:hypothetical protein